MFEFASIKTEKINSNILKEDFVASEYGDADVFYISKEMYEQDPESPEDNFKYRFAIRVEDYGEYGLDNPSIEVSIHLVPLSEKLLKMVNKSCGVEYESIEDIYLIEDLTQEGYSILMDSESYPYSYDNEQEQAQADVKANSQAIVAANMVSCINSLRGFYLDRCVNRIGTTGWDLLNDWVFEKGDWVKSTLAKYSK